MKVGANDANDEAMVVLCLCQCASMPYDMPIAMPATRHCLLAGGGRSARPPPALARAGRRRAGKVKKLAVSLGAGSRSTSTMVSKAALAAAERRKFSATNGREDAWKRQPASTAEKVANVASRKIADMESDLFSPENLDVIPRFTVGELSLGRVLGKGGFGTVNEIRAIECKDTGVGDDGAAAPSSHGCDDDDLIDKAMQQDKRFIADHCTRGGGDSR